MKKLLLSLAIMMLSLLVYQGIISILFQGVHHRSQAFFVTVLGVAVGGTVFISTIIKLELFTIREWLSLPYGAKILRMRQKIKEVNVMRLDKFFKSFSHY